MPPTQSRLAGRETERFEVGERVICPVHTDDKWHNATVLEYPVYFNERQKEKYVRVRVEDCGREESVLRREALKVNQE